jgi:hypothetical protein
MRITLVGVDPTRRLVLDVVPGEPVAVELAAGGLTRSVRVRLDDLGGLSRALEEGGDHAATGRDVSLAVRDGCLEAELRGAATLRARFALDPSCVPLAASRLRVAALHPLARRAWTDDTARVEVTEFEADEDQVLVHVFAWLDGEWSRGSTLSADVLRWVPRAALAADGLDAPGLRVLDDDGEVVVEIDDGDTRLAGRIPRAWEVR